MNRPTNSAKKQTGGMNMILAIGGGVLVLVIIAAVVVFVLVNNKPAPPQQNTQPIAKDYSPFAPLTDGTKNKNLETDMHILKSGFENDKSNLQDTQKAIKDQPQPIKSS
jgi:flagellar basal body-associated protein FliL